MTDFGRDFACTDDLDELCGEVTGPRIVLEAVYRRLSTERGGLIGAPNYGLSLKSLLSKGMTPVQREGIPGLVRAEALKEERVLSCKVKSTWRGAEEQLELLILCETDVGPFEMTFGIDEAEAKLLGVRL